MEVGADGTPTTVPIQRCRAYENQYGNAESRGNGSEYTGGHLERKCADTGGQGVVNANVWTYQTGSSGALDWKQIKTWCDGDGCEKYLGTYKLYTILVDGHHSPVQFRFTGHNVILGGSHFDEYVMDYHSIVVGAPPSGRFEPPMGMSCRAEGNPFGPTATVAALYAKVPPAEHPPSHPAHDLALLFPGGAGERLREEHFAAYSKTHGKTHASGEERHARKQHFHKALRYVR